MQLTSEQSRASTQPEQACAAALTTVPVFAVHPERAWLRAAVTAFIDHVTAALADVPQAAARVAVTRKMP